MKTFFFSYNSNFFFLKKIGQRSQYQCTSTGDSSHTCSRSIQNCASSACQDSTCRSLGTWTNRQANTDCGKTIARTCVDSPSNLCTNDICNSQWNGQTCASTGTCYSQSSGSIPRCLNPSNATNCNDNSVCTTDSCIPATGCSFVNKTLPSNVCYTYACNAQTGNFFTVNATACPASGDLCIFNYCDPEANSGAGQCRSINKHTLALGSSSTYKDANGNVGTITGCQKTQGSGCIIYGCNSTTGQCFQNTSLCQCTKNSDCDGKKKTFSVKKKLKNSNNIFYSRWKWLHN